MIEFITNKYTRWYFNIIEQRKTFIYDGYTEKHHVIPIALGGTSDSSNLVRLSAREHFICHILLTKMTTGKARRSMIYAANMLRRLRHQVKINSRLYETIKRLMSETVSLARTGTHASEETKKKISIGLQLWAKHNPDKVLAKNWKSSRSHVGKRHSETSLILMRNAQLGKKASKETKEKMRRSAHGTVTEEHKRKIGIALSGRKLSEVTRNKISAVALKRDRFQCDHCNTIATKSNLNRWHNANCRSIH